MVVEGEGSNTDGDVTEISIIPELFRSIEGEAGGTGWAAVEGGEQFLTSWIAMGSDGCAACSLNSGMVACTSFSISTAM